MMSRRYSLFGLNIESDFDLPDLAKGDTAIPIDVMISRVSLAPEMTVAGGVHDLGEGSTLLNIPEAGRYLCSANRLLVEPAPGVPQRNVALYLLGSAMGLVIHKRGLLALHANAVIVDGRAVVFLGHSGAGKSTLAAWFLDRGYALLADDVVVVQFDGSGTALAQPGLARLRLWREALIRTGRSPAGFERSYVGDETWDKFDVPTAVSSSAAAPIAAIILLSDHGRGDLERIEGASKVEALFANTYRGAYIPADQTINHWRQCVLLGRTIPLWLWRRSFRAEQMDGEVSALLGRLSAMVEDH